MAKPLLNSGNYTQSPPTPLDLTIPAELGGQRLDQALAQLLPQYSRSRLQCWIQDGAITLAGAVVEPKHKVWGGEAVHVQPTWHPNEAPALAEAIQLDLIYEDAALLVINKPAGLVVHPGSGNWSGTLMNALLHHTSALRQVPRAGIVHRLDKETSGLLVVAKTLEAQIALVRQLQARTVKRHYLALVEGRIEQDGTVDAPIGRHPTVRTKMAVVPHGKPARTFYHVIEHFPQHTLIECRLESGRTHQIRVHMQSIGHPLVGDPTYGTRKTKLSFKRQALHAAHLGLMHPASGEAMQWEVPLPADMQALLDSLRQTT